MVLQYSEGGLMEEVKLHGFNIEVEELLFNDGEYTWGVETVTLEPEADLSIDDMQVDKELTRMGHTIAYYGDLSARLKSQLARKEEDIDAWQAAADKELREKMAGNAKPPTETYLKKLLLGRPEYLSLVKELGIVRAQYYRLDNLVRALYKKADSLQTLSHNQRTERKVY